MHPRETTASVARDDARLRGPSQEDHVMTCRHPRPTLVRACVALAFVGAFAANTPMQARHAFARTAFTIAAAGGIRAPAVQGGGAGRLELDGVQGEVRLALPYWSGIVIGYPGAGLTGGDGDGDRPDIRFDGIDLTGRRVAAGGSNDEASACYRMGARMRVRTLQGRRRCATR
jgi:hypothetical protein